MSLLPIFSSQSRFKPNRPPFSYNHRGYRGSSHLEPFELTDAASTRTTYVRDLVLFLEYLNATLGLPRKPIVVGWEKGCNVLLGLASPTFLPQEIRERGASNVSCLILNDCPGYGLGRVPTSDVVQAMIACPFPSLTSYTHSPKCQHIHQQTSASSEHAAAHREGSNSTSSSFSTSGEEADGMQPLSRTDRHLSWICGFYKHYNHLPRDSPHVEPAYSSWAYKCSSELLPRALVESSFEVQNTPQTTPQQSPTRGSSGQFPGINHLWKLSDDRNQQVEFARVALTGQTEIPIALVWNGESPESIIDAAKEAGRMGGKVYLLSETGNALMFAHEPSEWLAGVMRVAMDISAV